MWQTGVLAPGVLSCNLLGTKLFLQLFLQLSIRKPFTELWPYLKKHQEGGTTISPLIQVIKAD